MNSLFVITIIIILVTVTVVYAYEREYYEESSNPNPSFGSWSEVHGPITDHFDQWLQRNGYEDMDYAQRYFGLYGSYGGRTKATQKIHHTPIVFIHGNEDGALAVPGNYTSGSSAQIQYFISQGYTSAELYVTTWGQRDDRYAMENDHSCAMLSRLRRFIEAVMVYTESRWINVISHSMGVTVARKVVKGGKIEQNDGVSCDLGPPLTNKVGVFIGIAGANYGMCPCQGPFALLKTCSKKNGFWPGDQCGSNHLKCHSNDLELPCEVDDYSHLLKEMNEDGIREGQFVYSFWTLNDDIIPNSARVWGRPTSIIPNGDHVFIFQNHTHMQAKELTGAQQRELLAPYEKYQRQRSYSYCLLYLLILLLIGIVILRVRIMHNRPIVILRFRYEFPDAAIHII